MKWTDDRCDELQKFRRLLIEASTINHGSDAVKRILECEELATILFQTDLSGPRVSFYQFLVELAGEDRKAQRDAAPNGEKP